MGKQGGGIWDKLFGGAKTETATTENDSLRELMERTPVLTLSFNYDRSVDTTDVTQVDVGLDRVLKCLAKLKLLATFHCAAKLCDTAATQIAHIRDAGHEIACHGYSKENLVEQTPESLQRILLRCRDLMARRGIAAHGYHPPSEYHGGRLYKELSIQGFRYITELEPTHTPTLLLSNPHPLIRMPITSNDSGYLRHREEPNYVYDKHHKLVQRCVQGRTFVALNYHLSLLGEHRQRLENLLLVIEGAMKNRVSIRPFSDALPAPYRPAPAKKPSQDPWSTF